MPKPDQDGSNNGWHLRKEISIGHIVTTVTVAAGVLLAYADLDKRVSLNSQAINQASLAAEKQEQRSTQALKEINDALRRIEARLDRVIDGRRPEQPR